MNEQTFSDPQRYVIKNWLASRKLELAMEKIRKSYTEVGERIVAEIQERHKELDYCKAFLTQNWDSGTIYIGRKAWVDNKEYFPTGYVLENLRLDYLTDDTQPQPTLSIWLNKPEKKKVDKSTAINVIANAAQKLLTPAELKMCRLRPTKDSAIEYSLPETKSQLLDMLITDNSQTFVDSILTHFEVIAKFSSIIDGVYQSNNKESTMARTKATLKT